MGVNIQKALISPISYLLVFHAETNGFSIYSDKSRKMFAWDGFDNRFRLLIHRHKLVQIRTRVKNELQHLLLNQECRKAESVEHGGRTALLPLELWTDGRNKDLLKLSAVLDAQLESLNDAVTQVAKECPGVRLLMSRPGVGAITTLASVLTLRDVHSFPRGKQVASYLGLIPREHSWGRSGEWAGSANKVSSTELPLKPQRPRWPNQSPEVGRSQVAKRNWE